MTYVKAIQSYDTQIESLEIKGDKTFSLLIVSFFMIFPIAIVYHAIGFNPYAAQLIPLSLELYFIVIGYAFLLLTIYQGILEICRDFLLAKELFVRITRRYGVKKGASSLINICTGRRANKLRSITQKKSPHPTKPSPENAVYKSRDIHNGLIKSIKNIQADNETKSDKLDKGEEKDQHPRVTEVVNHCMSEKNENRSNFIHQTTQYNRKGKANFKKIVEELNKECPVYSEMTYKNKYLLVKERLPDHMKCTGFLIPT